MKHSEWIDTALEEQVVATFLLNKNHIDISLVETEYFSEQIMRTLYKHIRSLWMEGKITDLVSVGTSCHEAGILDHIGGWAYITEMMTHLYAPATIDHVYKLRDLWQRRETQKALIDATLEINEGVKPSKVIDALDQKVMPILDQKTVNTYQDKDKQLDDTLDSMLNPTEFSCIHTGWMSIDKMIGGYRPQEMIVIAGRPGMGKTGYMVSSQLNLAVQGIPSLTFSLDMGQRQLWNRYFSQTTMIPVNEMEIGKTFTTTQRDLLQEARFKLSSLPFWIDSHPYRNLHEIRMITRQMKMRHDVKVIFLDHIGKINPVKAESREQEVSKIAQGLKAMSKELDVTVVTMVQLNRMVETRADKKPMLSDLRESGAIEQEADIVLMTYRPESYGMDSFPDTGVSSQGKLEILGTKVRNASKGSIMLSFEGSCTKVSEYDDSQHHSHSIGMDLWETN